MEFLWELVKLFFDPVVIIFGIIAVAILLPIALWSVDMFGGDDEECDDEDLDSNNVDQ